MFTVDVSAIRKGIEQATAKPDPTKLAADASGHQHKGPGAGGGQFESKGGSGGGGKASEDHEGSHESGPKVATKYPRTPHVPNSPGGTRDDRRAKDLKHFVDREIVITEKMDGSNVRMTRDAMTARSQSGSPRHPSFDRGKAIHAEVRHAIPEGWAVFGEYVYAQHSIAYDKLPGYFMVFGAQDETGKWQDWDTVGALAADMGVPTVPTVFRGKVGSEKELADLTDKLGNDKSAVGSQREGVVVRLADSFDDLSQGVAKWVRAGHVQPDDEHWTNKRVEKNDLKPQTFAAWDESKHPRGNKDNAGEFGPGGSGPAKPTADKPAANGTPASSAGKPQAAGGEPAKASKPKLSPEEKKAASEAHFETLMAAKTPSDAAAFRKAREDGVSIPPAWTEVVYHGADKDKVAEGRDAKGRKQVSENPEYRQNVSDANNARIAKDLTPRMGELRDELRAAAKAGNEEAKVLYLITLTGFRIGGKGDGKAKEQAFGASSLRGDHVKVEGNTVTFDFPGKKGVRQQHSVTDPVVAKMMQNVEPGKPVFATRDTKVRDVWQTKYGGDRVHDIRHVVASEIAERELAKRIPPFPKTEREKAAIMKEVGTIAAHTLGNDPAQALGTYIDPALWVKLKVAA